MPCLIRILRGTELHPADYSAESLAQAATFEPKDGVYTVANTFNTYQTLKLDAHLDRMEDSARRVGIALTLNRDLLKKSLRQLITEAGYGDVRFRVTVPQDASYLILSVEPFTPLTPQFLAQGVRVITVPDSARHEAAAKTTDWMHQRRTIAEAMPPDIYDAILLDGEGHLMEGLGANFYAVLDDELRTAGAGVLAGIAQSIVFEVAPGVLPVVKQVVQVADVPRLQEAFITSSSRGIVPVVAIDGHTLGTGTPGAKTLELLARYNAWVINNLQAL